MIHGKNCRLIRAQNLGSHGSKSPHTTPNRHTRSSATWKKNKRTRRKQPEKTGGGWAHLPVGQLPWSAEWAPSPPISSLQGKLPTAFLKSVWGAMRRPTRCKMPIELPYKYERGGKNGVEKQEALLSFSLLSSCKASGA